MLADEIKKFFRGDVATDARTLEQYSRDYSIFKVKPQIVVFPKDADDVKALVKFVRKQKEHGVHASLTGRSAGTDMTGGPLTESIVVCFTRYMNRARKIGKDFAVVEPGLYFRDFEKMLDAKGLLYPPFPASKDFCALGGMVSNNSGGEKTLRYGKTEDYVEEVKVVLEDGEEHLLKPLSKEELVAKLKKKDFEAELYRRLLDLIEANYETVARARPDVSKNSSGYALWSVWNKEVFNPHKLIVGAQGTLGLVTEAKLKLVPAPAAGKLIVVFLRDLGPLAKLVNELLKFDPESLESYDDKTLGVALRYLPALLRSMRGEFFLLMLKFIPEFFMMLRGGMPKMILLVSLTGASEPELAARARALADAVRSRFGVPVRVVKNKTEEEKYWTIRRQSFALLHGHIHDRDTAPFIDDIVVKPEYLPQFLPQLDAILARYKGKLIYTIAGHPGNGNFHIIPLMDLKDEKIKALIPKISEEVYRLVFSYRGSITAEHNDGLIRTPYVKEMYGRKVYALFEEVKRLFDPLRIFNPGKKVDGDLDYAVRHIESSR